MKIPDRLMAKATETMTVLIFKGFDQDISMKIISHILKENEEFIKARLYSRVLNALKNLDAKNVKQINSFIEQNSISVN